MSIHPNLFRNGRDPKEEAKRLAELYTGFTYFPKRGGSKISRKKRKNLLLKQRKFVSVQKNRVNRIKL
jgi:hypothetical protein